MNISTHRYHFHSFQLVVRPASDAPVEEEVIESESEDDEEEVEPPKVDTKKRVFKPKAERGEYDDSSDSDWEDEDGACCDHSH